MVSQAGVLASLLCSLLQPHSPPDSFKGRSEHSLQFQTVAQWDSTAVDTGMAAPAPPDAPSDPGGGSGSGSGGKGQDDPPAVTPPSGGNAGAAIAALAGILTFAWLTAPPSVADLDREAQMWIGTHNGELLEIIKIVDGGTASYLGQEGADENPVRQAERRLAYISGRLAPCTDQGELFADMPGPAQSPVNFSQKKKAQKWIAKHQQRCLEVLRLVTGRNEFVMSSYNKSEEATWSDCRRVDNRTAAIRHAAHVCYGR